MKTLLLVITLAAHAEAPNAGISPATVAPAAVAASPILLAANDFPASTTATLPVVMPCAQYPWAHFREMRCVAQIGTVHGTVPTGAVLGTAPTIEPVLAGRVCVFPQPVDAAECSVTALLRTRFLSGPWSAARRLNAARRRGDTDEVQRMEAALDAFIAEAMILDDH